MAGLSALDGYAIALAAVAAYALAVLWLYRSGRIGPDRSISLFGPALMLKTKRGNAFIERLGRFRRLWSALGDLGLVLAAVSMGAIVIVLAIAAVIVSKVPASAAPQASEALGIPGLNPIIPLGYGIVALVVGIVLHELMHGVMARSQNIGVKTVGVLWLVLPVGAFVEQEEGDMEGAKRRQRGRVAAAGILANFLLAILFFALLSGVVASGVAANANGVGVAYVLPGFPASNSTLEAGDIITSVNGTTVTSSADLVSALQNTSPRETIAITYVPPSSTETISTSVTLTSASSYDHLAQDAHKGFLGISTTFLTPTQLRTELADPAAASFGALPGLVYWLVLPIAGQEPVQGTNALFFHLTGPLAVLGASGFWIVANLLFWLAWMNLLLGVSNALPLVPLDGGLLFRDFSGAFFARVRRGWDQAKVDLWSGRAVAASSALVIFLIVWQFVGPRL